MKLARCYCPFCHREGPAMGSGLIWNCRECGSQTKPPKNESVAFWIAFWLVIGVLALCAGALAFRR